MEKKNEDDRNEEREQLTQQQQQTNKLSFHRPLSNCLSIDYQINKNSRHKTSTNNDHHYPPIILPSERTSLPMKSSTLPQYTSNPSLINTKSKQQYIDDQSTYSVSHQTNKLPHAKSYGELYQSSTTFSISSPVKKINEENKTKQHETSTVLTPVKMRVPVTTVTNSTEQSQSSPSNKIPFWKRFKKMIVPTKRTKDQQTSTSSKIPTLLLDELIDNQSNLTITDSVQAKLLHNPLKLSELKTWINSQIFPEDQIRAEYDKLPTESLYPKTVALQTENRSKNRFNSIEPYDHSRVILKTLPNDSTSDYINASYIDGYQTNRMYIAAQAPTDATLGDFIRMIWQLRIQSIVMLTRLFEDGKHKSVQYWPDQGQKQVNNFQINLDNEEKYAFYTIRRMTISNQFESSDILIVNHYHFLSWPDHDCVSLPTPLLEFRQRFHTDSKSSLPILVHCSAGVGRSGTFIALDTLLEMSQTAEIIDILEFTHRMRQNRVYMIQTADQYVFLYRALIEGILTEQTSISLKEFMITRKVHMDIKDQYKLLEQLQSNIRFSYHSALDPQNFNKNRFENILAPDNNRPYLMTQIDKTTDYINAVFVNSYRHISNYIVTQYPLPNTLVDFWRLVYDHKISIIMLIEPIARDSKTPVYWPLTTSQNVTIGPFEIVLNSQKEDDSLIEHIFHLNYQTKNSNIQLFDRQRTIRQFQVKDSSRLLSIVKRFLKEMKTRSEQNVLIQCLNGVTWSGYFIALCNAIDQMQTEQIIDPFKTVRLLRSNREQFINQNQYENLFVSMIDYAQQYLSI